MVLGLQYRILPVTADDNFSLRGDTLRKALEEDATLGKKPFILSKFPCRPTSCPLADCCSRYNRNYFLWCH